MPALRTSILAAVVAAVTARALPGVKGVYLRKGKRASSAERYPAVVVRRAPRPDEANRLTFHYDAPGYPVEVLYVVLDPLGADADTDRVDDWNQSLSRLFKEPEVLRAAVAGVWGVDVRPLTQIDPDDKQYQGVIGGLSLTVKTWEPRG